MQGVRRNHCTQEEFLCFEFQILTHEMAYKDRKQKYSDNLFLVKCLF